MLGFSLRALPHNHAKLAAANIVIPQPDTAYFDDGLASATDFDRFALLGGALMCGLTGSDLTAGRQIRDMRNLPSAASASPRSYRCDFNGHWQFRDMLRGLVLNGVSVTNRGDNECYRVEHWDPEKKENGQQVPLIKHWYTADGAQYRATGGFYEFGINQKGRAIFGLYLDSPETGGKQNWYGNTRAYDRALLPRLRSLSEVLWGFWVRDNPHVQIIRYFFMLGISNEATNQIIASCLNKMVKELRDWPGVSLGADTDDGHALLGSPNGAVFAYFLMQHKAQLGHKTITRITVVRPENDDENDFVDASLIFHVKTAPDPPLDDDGNGDVKVKRRNGREADKEFKSL
ncbi:hypothetical protein EK21DRAFT_101493 [Setomelanomma holmii]|uniref:Uncharacterized protein n=1 Tax=Setomelanomma holmii TaxID=210430 RepID=A0A9P4LJ72_9PLEO|nr:hypothetical protein EK21DRAFT_101493 [Setomelanomma holmii]